MAWKNVIIFRPLMNFFMSCGEQMGILTESLKIAGNLSTGNAKVNWPGKREEGHIPEKTERK